MKKGILPVMRMQSDTRVPLAAFAMVTADARDVSLIPGISRLSPFCRIAIRDTLTQSGVQFTHGPKYKHTQAHTHASVNPDIDTKYILKCLYPPTPPPNTHTFCTLWSNAILDVHYTVSYK